MRRRLRTTAAATALALGVHALFALLLLLERNAASRPRAVLPQPNGIRITMHPLTMDTSPQQASIEVQPSARPGGSLQRPPAPVLPASSITPVPTAPDFDPARPDAPSALPAMKGAPYWFNEASRVAREAAERDDTDHNIGGPVRAMRRPCKPRKSSFEWKDKPVPEDPPPLENPLLPPPGSVVMGGARTGTVGISIPLGGKPEPNKHLFDDMLAGRTPSSSVPDPNVCD